MPNALTRRGAVILSAVCLACLMFGLEISSVPTILPTLEEVLHADFKQLQWVMNAYTIAVTTVLMAVGALADRYGRKRIFLISIAAFGVTSLICGVAPNVQTLIIARFLQGMSGGALLICQIAVLSYEFQGGRERAIAWGWWGVIFGIGLGFGPIIGGGIVAVSSWKWVFLIHVLLAVLAFVLSVTGVHESKDPQASRLDVAGILTLSLAVFCLVFYITQGPDFGFASTSGLAILGLSALSFIAFVIAEKVSARPMFDFSVFGIRPFLGAIIGSSAMNTSFWPFMIYLPIWMQVGLGYDSVSAGLSPLAYTRSDAYHAAARRAPIASLSAQPGHSRRSVHHRRRLLPDEGRQRGSAPDLADDAARMSDRRHRSWDREHTRHEYDDGISVERPCRHGVRHRYERPHGLARGQLAVMGFILASGVAAHLKSALPSLEGTQLRPIAEKIAAGDSVSVPGLTPSIVHEALANGFGWVLLYGAIGVWIMSALSFLVFNVGAVRQPTIQSSE